MGESKEGRKARQLRVQAKFDKLPFLVKGILGVPILWWLQYKDWRETKP